MTIPFIDLKAQMARIEPAVRARMDKVLEHGAFIMGPEVAELEQKLSQRCGCKHAIGVASGTDALQVILMGWNVGPGDAVFVSSFTFTASAEVILVLGATPVFVDVDPVTCNMDEADLERRIDEVKAEGKLTPKAVIAVDLYGQPADYRLINPIAKAHGMKVLADAAQSFGGSLDGVPVGKLADATATSFFPAKPLGCFGDGGAIFTDDDDLAAAARSIRLHGKGSAKYDIVRVGLNSRLDTLQAAVLLAKLEIFDDELAARDSIALTYDKFMAGLIDIPERIPGARSTWAQYSIQDDHRDRLADMLKEKGIPTGIYYPLPMHLQPAYAAYGKGPGSLPASEKIATRTLSLPMHPYLDRKVQMKIADAVTTAWGL